MPINRTSICSDLNGNRYRMEIMIETHADTAKYPEGVKAIFRLIRLDINKEGETELVILIDNHAPFGFHSHDKLPEKHHFRTPLHMNDWREAWKIFQLKCREILR